MQILTYNSADFESCMRSLYERKSYPAELEPQVAAILADVREHGDEALLRYAEKFDRVKLTRATLRVSEQEFADAESLVDADDKKAIERALAHVQDFARRRIPEAWSCNPRRGVTLGEQFVPIERVGVYIPGGTAPLVSTVIHTAGIAAAAGVPQIVAATPCRPDGTVQPAVLCAMKRAGVTEVYKLGGVYAIAALAFGTESVRKVEKIVGPGNAYVTAAKKLVYGNVSIDMVAGPSEIMVVADATGNPEFIAADLLSQAEHGSGLEQAVLVTTDPSLPTRVIQALDRRKATLPRLATVEKVYAHGMFLIVAKDLAQAADIASKYAPEHLELHTEQPRELARSIRSCGAIFLGPWTPEPIGDFCAGPSHVLPTAGSARFFGGLSVEGFFRRMSMVEYTRDALADDLDCAKRFAALETLTAHGRSASVRLEE